MFTYAILILVMWYSEFKAYYSFKLPTSYASFN
jgi:hypothetical protein